MNDKEKRQIETLRSAGYSYSQIAALLGINRNTVTSHCRRFNVDSLNRTTKKVPVVTRYGLCPYCRELFVITSNQQRRFCSEKCRNKYWQAKKSEDRAKDQEFEEQKTLQKELDFLAKKSDELDGSEEVTLYYTKSPDYTKRE